MAATMADLGFNIDSSPMRRATGELDKMSKGAGRAEKATAGLASAANVSRIAVASLGAVVGGLGVSRLIRETTDFDSALRRLQATSQATGDQMAQLEKQARTLGATTIFSAKETADAQQFLAMAGFEVNKIMAATPSVLKLATAANMGLAQAADIASNVLGGMRLEVSQLDRVIDVMASTTSGSNTNIQQLGTALSFAAPLAASAGVEIEEVAAAIGTLSDAGLQGSRAGTGLVGVIRQLSNVTPDAQKALDRYGITLSEVDITTRGLAPVLRTLREANISTSDAFKVFGSEAGAAAQILASGSVRVREFTEELGSAEGSADAMARTIGGGLAGSWASFNSALSETILRLEKDEGVAGGFQDVTDAATGILSVYNGMLPQFAKANDLTNEQVEGLESQAAMLKAVTFGLGAVATVYGTVAVATRAATVAQVAFNFAARTNPYLLIASSIAAAAAAIYSFTNAQESAVAVWERATESEAAYQAALGDVSAANRVQEITKERMESESRLQALRDRGAMANASHEAGRQAAIKTEMDLLSDLDSEYNRITNARIEAEKAASDRRKEAREAEAEAIKLQAELTQQQAEAESASAAAERASTIDQIDLLRERLGLLKEGTVEFRKNAEIVRKAVDMGVITKEQASQIVEAMRKAGEEAGDEFSEKFAETAFDAILDQNWKKLGTMVGGEIGKSLINDLSGYLNDNFGEAFSEMTKGGGQGGLSFSAALGGLGEALSTALANPISGAVIGAIATEAASKVGEFLAFDDFDPTEARQAAQGTGTVLGSIDAKSESIAKATDRAATASRELVGINRDMLRALQAVQMGISGASARVARGSGGGEFDIPSVMSGRDLFSSMTGGVLPILDETIGAAFDFFDTSLNFLTLGMFDLGGLIGGKVRKRDEGIQIIGGYIEDLIDETMVNAYATFRVKKHRFSSTKTKERFQRIGGDVEQQFALVFESLFDSVVAGADVLGVDAASRLNSFRVSTQRLSLEDLNAEQQTAELEAYFGTVFDNMAQHTIPWLEDFQMAGEGLGETLARVATDVAVTEQAVDMLGLRFSSLSGRALVEASQRLVEVNGGMEQFISGMQNFISNFATEAQQFEINANALASGMGSLPLPETREGFWQLLQAQDAATAAGAENIATLLRLQGTANEYYSALEKAQQEAQKQQEEYYQGEINGQRDRLNEAVKAQSAVESALGRMVLDSRSVQQASRTNALEALRRAASSGRVTASDELDRNLSAATAMQASDYATFGEYIQDYTRTTGTLLDLKEITDRQVTTEERMLSSLERQLEAVTGLRQDLERTQLALIKQTNKSAKVLERIEIDGLEVRA